MPIPTVSEDSALYTSDSTIRTYLISGPTLKSEFLQYVEGSGVFIGYATGRVFDDKGTYLVETTYPIEDASGDLIDRLVYTPFDQLRIVEPSPNYWFIVGFFLALLLLLITVVNTISDSKDKNNTAKPKKTK